MPRAWGATAAVAGGAGWAVHAGVLAGRPAGCVGDACSLPGASSRSSEDLALLALSAVVLLAVAATALGRDERQRGGGLLRAGAALLWSGAALLTIGLAVNAVLAGDSPLWWLHDTDSLVRLVPVAGSFLVGAGLLRRRSGSSWVGAAIMAAALVSVPFNAQDDRVLLDVPLGLAWVVAGASWSVRRRRTQPVPVPAPGPTTSSPRPPSDRMGRTER